MRTPAVVIGRLRRITLGRPLPTSAAGEQRLTRPRAMGAFGLDALSSVAYGPDEILYVVILAGTAGVRADLPIAGAIAALLGIVAFSYRQTIFAYPRGGGSYTVARENLGTGAGLVAAAALIVDYLTTIAVSVTAGVQAIIAFAPGLNAHRVIADVALIAFLVLINLRGVREAGAAFVIPTYIFIGSLAVLILDWALRSGQSRFSGTREWWLHPYRYAFESEAAAGIGDLHDRHRISLRHRLTPTPG